MSLALRHIHSEGEKETPISSNHLLSKSPLKRQATVSSSILLQLLPQKYKYNKQGTCAAASTDLQRQQLLRVWQGSSRNVKQHEYTPKVQCDWLKKNNGEIDKLTCVLGQYTRKVTVTSDSRLIQEYSTAPLDWGWFYFSLSYNKTSVLVCTLIRNTIPQR